MTHHRARLLLACSFALILNPLAAQAQSAASAKPAKAKSRARDGYSLAFVDADVRRVVDAVLGSMLETEYSVDPAVKGNITLRTRQPVPREELLPLLESALQSVDAVVIAQGSAYRIIPRKDARTRAPVASAVSEAGERATGYATEVVTLKNGSAKEIARLLEQFVGKDLVSTNPAYNQIIITGSAEEREGARALIDRFDVDTLAGMAFETYKLENVDADTMVAELERIFQPPFDIIGTRVRLIPLPRLRSVIAIALDRADISRIEPWIRKLDTGVSGKRKLYSYSVQYGRARDLAASLQLVLGISSSGNSSGPARAAPAPMAAAPVVVESGGADPSDAIASQTPLPGASTPVLGSSGGEGPRIVPNDETNALLIFANGEEYDFIREALEKLDQPVAQVLIEATLAEVTLTNDFRFGVNFKAIRDDLTVVNSGNSAGSISPIFPGVSALWIGGSAQAVLNTLQSKTNVRVLSAPKLIVLNNQTATLQVGDQVPIITQQAQSVAAPGAPVVNNVELRDTGVILKVTPRVNDQGSITLDIAQEVSDVAETTTSGINSPTIQQRRIASTVATRSGQMIALGGLIRDRDTRGKSGIPLVSQIPVIGGLFGSHTGVQTRTELIILLTPTVIRSPDEVRDVVDQLIDGLDRARPLVDRAIKAQVHVPPKTQ